MEWIYYDPLPPSLFLVTIFGSCAIMHLAANGQLLLLLMMMMQPTGSCTAIGSQCVDHILCIQRIPSGNCRQNYSSLCCNVLVLKY